MTTAEALKQHFPSLDFTKRPTMDVYDATCGTLAIAAWQSIPGEGQWWDANVNGGPPFGAADAPLAVRGALMAARKAAYDVIQACVHAGVL